MPSSLSHTMFPLVSTHARSSHEMNWKPLSWHLMGEQPSLQPYCWLVPCARERGGGEGGKSVPVHHDREFSMHDPQAVDSKEGAGCTCQRKKPKS
jgi:hypothetical protein